MISVKDKPWKYPIYCVLTILGASLICWVALSLSYCIPSSWMAQNALESSKLLNEEGIRPNLHNYESVHYDNFTDARMLNEALYSDGGNPFVEAMESKEFNQGEDHIEKLRNASSAILDNAVEDVPTYSYSRYWHGFLIYLKPLLCLFDLQEIRLLFQLLFICTLSVLCVKISRLESGIVLLIGVLTSMVAFNVFEAAGCLAFFPSMLIPVIGGIAVFQVKKLSMDRVFWIFLLTGICISIFDFLDNPILSWGIPASFVVVRFLNEGKSDWGCLAKMLLLSMVIWGAGYGLTWLCKLLLASVITGQDVIADASEQAYLRTGGEEMEVGFLSQIRTSISKNLTCNPLAMHYMAFLFICDFVLLLVALFRRHSSYAVKTYIIVLSFFVFIAAIALAWFVILSNHSTIHFWFTFRDLLLTSVAMSSSIWALFCFSKYQNPDLSYS